ncbi:MAG: hypothetical protein GXY59_11370 [Bacteroidales bacterium]|jgi:uncharacterized protein YhbP (UPF0306 family)|nr:hypothetical protein [Bacteroidales bacterium]
MSVPEKGITDFIRKHHVVTLATCAGSVPWVCHCFYAYMKEENWLVFTSDDQTRHVREVLANPEVAGGIVLETSVVSKVQGIQFRGTMRRPTEEEKGSVTRAYLARFPFAVLMNASLWIVEIHSVKMTDNRLGFGKKLHWER